MSVLLVEDDEQIRKLMAYGLRSIGLSVVEAASVEEVIPLSIFLYDFVISDYSLEDGTAQDIHKLVNCNHFVVITGHSIDSWSSDVCVLNKPVDFETLIETLLMLSD